MAIPAVLVTDCGCSGSVVVVVVVKGFSLGVKGARGFLFLFVSLCLRVKWM